MAVGNNIYALEGWPNSPSTNNIVRRCCGAADVWRADLASSPTMPLRRCCEISRFPS
jgi:hypothetical protein